MGGIWRYWSLCKGPDPGDTRLKIQRLRKRLRAHGLRYDIYIPLDFDEDEREFLRETIYLLNQEPVG